MASSAPSSSSLVAAHHAEHAVNHVEHAAAYDDRALTIIYATETGTAQDAADRIARLCRGLRIRVRMHSMDVYPPVRVAIRRVFEC